MDATSDTSIVSHIVINIAQQRLSLFSAGQLLQDYAISTAKNGVGQENGSGCTPLGEHTIRAKVGADSPIGTVFAGRRPT
ncbi:MAG: L,D-transpeptidase, partial [Burkholderiaceae bacterium]